MKRLLRLIHICLLDPFVRLPLCLALVVAAMIAIFLGNLRLAAFCFLLVDLLGLPTALAQRHSRLSILYALLAVEGAAVVVPSLPILFAMMALSLWFYWGDGDGDDDSDDRRSTKVRREQLRWSPDSDLEVPA